MSFVFSADGHIVEPRELFTEGLPPSLREHGMHAEMRDGFMFMMAGSKVMSKVALNRPPRPKVVGKDGEVFRRSDRLGSSALPRRRGDSKAEGIDAEIVFPSAGLFLF